MNEDKASRYHRLTRRARGLELLWSAGLLLVVLMSPASARLRDLAAGWTSSIRVPPSLSPGVTVALYVLVLAALHECAAGLLAYYRDHVLESRYGLSTQSAGRWLRAHLKATGVGLVFAQAGVWILYVSIRIWPGWWWVAAAAAFPLATVWLAKAAPGLLLPWFFRPKPIERKELQQRLVDLAGKAGTRVLGVYGWTVSDSTRAANAALVGLGRTRRILLSDTLLANYSDDEVEVVLAHELAHHVHRDIWRALALDTASTFAGFFLAHRALIVFAPALGIAGPSDVAGLPLILLASDALWLAVLPLANARSRAEERRADRFALRLTGNPSAFASALRRLAQQNLAEERPSRLARAIFCSHPPIAERLQIARDTGA